MTHQYGDVVRMRFFAWPAYLVNHPEGVKHILQVNQLNYNKDLYPYKALKPLLGRGLVTNDGEGWLHQRHLMQPAFHRKRLTAFGTLMTGATVAMLDRWEDLADRNQPLDVAAEMLRLALCIAGKALFSIDLSDEMRTIGQAVTTVNKLLTAYLSTPFPPLNVPTPRNRRLQVAYRTLDQVVHGIITQRRQQITDPGDLLSMLLAARDEETGQGMDDQQVRDEVITLLLAGHETVSTALTWTWYLLSHYPDVERRLHTELETVLGGQRPAVDHLAKLSYTRMVLEEALRLLPIRRGATHVHRQHLRTDGDAVNPGHCCATLPIAPGSWPPGRARSTPFAAPTVRLADDTPAYIRAQHEEMLDKAYIITDCEGTTRVQGLCTALHEAISSSSARPT